MVSVMCAKQLRAVKKKYWWIYYLLIFLVRLVIIFAVGGVRRWKKENRNTMTNILPLILTWMSYIQNQKYNCMFSSITKKPFLVEASTWCAGGKECKNEIDRIFDKPKVKETYINNKMELQAIKSYCKNQRNKIQVMVWQCHNLKMFKNQFARSYPYNTYAFRNKEYLVNDLIKKFFVEYVDDLIGSDKQYCDMEDIREYIDKLFD